jgi:hypothetical protein
LELHFFSLGSRPHGHHATVGIAGDDLVARPCQHREILRATTLGNEFVVVEDAQDSSPAGYSAKSISGGHEFRQAGREEFLLGLFEHSGVGCGTELLE